MCVMTAICMPSCGDNNSDDPHQPSVVMVLTEMRGNYLNTSYETSEVVFQAKYDAQGRIIESRNSDDGIWNKYVYTDSKITCRDVEYEVVDGKIVSSEYNDSYSYNANNQLVAVGQCSFTWKNGNITETSYKTDRGNYLTSLSYTDNPNVGNLNWMLNLAYSTCFPSEEAYVNDDLAVSGYYGIPCKNLCKSISVNGKFDRSFDYLDYNESGYPQTLKITDEDGDIQVYTLIWTML